MKKLLVLLPILLIGAACAPKAAEKLDPVDIDEAYSIKITRENCGLTTDDSTTEITTNLKALEDESIEYSFKVGSPAYQHGTYDEFVLKESSYIKSNSNYVVDRLIVEFYGPSVKFAVYNNTEGTGDELVYHESSTASEHPDDGGVVYDYGIGGKDWMIKNVSAPQKAAFYSITVIFTLE